MSPSSAARSPTWHGRPLAVRYVALVPAAGPEWQHFVSAEAPISNNLLLRGGPPYTCLRLAPLERVYGDRRGAPSPDFTLL